MQQPQLFSPTAELPISVNWAPWLGTASIASWSVSVPTGVTKMLDLVSGTVVMAKLKLTTPASANDGDTFDVAFTVTTNESPSRTDTRLVALQVSRRYAQLIEN